MRTVHRRNACAVRTLRAGVIAFASSCLTASIISYGHAAENANEVSSRPLRLVVGFSPVGGADVAARMLSVKLSEITKQSVVVENRPGAGGAIGAVYVANSPSDGHTLLVVSSSYATIPMLYPQQSFEPARDLAAVILIAEAPMLLLVHPSLPARSVKELIALAKAKSGQLNYSSGGEGTSSFLTGELFKSMAGVQIQHVPYKGAGPALIDTIAGQVEINFASVFSAMPHVKSGALRALGVSSAKRSVVLPDLPTIAEAGVKGYSRTTWYGVLAPARAPAAIISKLNGDFEKTLASQEVRQRLLADGSEPAGGSPKRFQDFLANEFEVTQKIIRRAGVSK
jgi:tripartite-type tricarboxylate transporter receptor subunit TctC